VYQFSSCVCGGIWPKSEQDLLLRWGAMKRAENRGSTLKIRLRVPSAMTAQLKKQQDAGAHSIPAPAAPPNISARVSSEATHNADVHATSSPDAELVRVESSDQLQISAESDRTGLLESAMSGGQLEQYSEPRVKPAEIPEPSVPLSAFAVDAPPTMITEEDVKYFRKLASSISKAPGKWAYLHSCFLKKYPDSKLGANALRC